MEVSDDINKIYVSVLKKLKSEGRIKAKRKELIFLPFLLENMDKNILFFPIAQRNWPWILREVSDRIFMKTNPGNAFHYSKNWENRIEENGYFSYHYANRLGNQMSEMLSKRKQSRDKVVTVWNKGDYNLDGRQPCTIMLQPIMEHDDNMSLVVYMRNNDIINLLPSDVFIHSTYFKYWAIKNEINYKNLYWTAGVAYYQKKRDRLNFTNRLINNWIDYYNTSNIKTHRWTNKTIKDLEYKEELEENSIWNYDFNSVLESLRKFETDYVRDWLKIMLLANYKKNKDKEKFNQIQSSKFNSEFELIKNSLKLTK